MDNCIIMQFSFNRDQAFITKVSCNNSFAGVQQTCYLRVAIVTEAFYTNNY